MRTAALPLLALLILLAACEAPKAKEVEAPLPTKTRDVAKAVQEMHAPEATGKELYVARCASCHAIEGTGALGPRTDLRASRLDSAQIHEVIEFGRPQKGMVSYRAILNPAEIDSLVGYVRKFQLAKDQ